MLCGDPNDVIATIGDIWKSWGWYVIERDDFQKPNRFGYAPDCCSLQVEAYRLPTRITPNPKRHHPLLLR